MTTFNGFILGDPPADATGRDPSTEGRSIDRASFVHPTALLDGSPIIEGGYTNERQVATRSLALTGYRQFSYFDDFYNRIFLVPAAMDFGNIADTTTRVLKIWNAYLVPRTLDEPIPPTGDGVTVTGHSFPVVLPPLSFFHFNIIAAHQGALQITGEIPFVFDTPETVNLPLAGRRGNVFLFEPDWSQSYKVTGEFKTDIITSRSGKDQRRALRNTPRKSIDYTVTVQNAEMRRLHDFFVRAQANVVLIADVSRSVLTTAPLALGDTTVEIGGAPPSWLMADAVVMLHAGADSSVVTVASVGGTSVTFNSLAVRDWVAGTRICPALSGHMNAQQSGGLLTNTAVQLAINFIVDPGSEPVIDLPAAPVTFNGREVFTFKPTWAQPIDITYGHAYETLDYGQGRVGTYQPVAFANRIFKATFIGKTAA